MDSLILVVKTRPSLVDEGHLVVVVAAPAVLGCLMMRMPKGSLAGPPDSLTSVVKEEVVLCQVQPKLAASPTPSSAQARPVVEDVVLSDLVLHVGEETSWYLGLRLRSHPQRKPTTGPVC